MEDEGNTEKQPFSPSEADRSGATEADGKGEAEEVAGVMWVDPAMEEDHGVSTGRGVPDIFENRGECAGVLSTAASAVAVNTVRGVGIHRNTSLPNPGDMFPVSPIYQLLFSFYQKGTDAFFIPVFFKLSCP